MLTQTLEEDLKRYRIGPKLRALRLKKKLGLQELSRHTGLSPALLSKVERDLLFPTLPTLLRIALVFGVGLDYFFVGPREQPVCEVIRRKDRIQMPDAPGETHPRYRFESLDYRALERKINAFFAEFLDTSHASDEHAHEGAEFIYVVSGTLGVRVGEVEHLLKTGDAMYFDSTVPHAYRRGALGRCSAVVVTAA